MIEKLPFEYQTRQYWQYYCPVCKVLRRAAYRPSPQKKHYAQLALTAFFLTTVLWSWTGAKGFFLVFPVWAAFEFFYRARARQSLICHKCGFDPFLFKFDSKLAKQKVAQFFEDRNKIKAEKSKPPGLVEPVDGPQQASKEASL